MDTTPAETPGERAGVMRRLVIVAIGVTFAGLGGAAPWALPEKCRWVGWVSAVLFVPAGCFVAFLGARGRAEDLREFKAAELAGGVVGEVFGLAVVAAIVALLSCLR